MNTEQFDNIVSNRLEAIKATLISKAKEYAKGDEDRLHNFNRGAQITGQSREKVLQGFMLKHLVSVFDMIDEPSKATQYMIDEKIGDCINYLVLLEASFKDRLLNKNKEVWQKNN
jgi:hypothetical protein